MKKNIQSKKFSDFSFNLDFLKRINDNGFINPTKIQEKVIPIVLENKYDIVGISQTGTGKTGAFIFPLLNNLEKTKEPTILILCPTRELSIQIFNTIEKFKQKEIKSVNVYGGSSIKEQVQKIKKGPEIIIGTPGRVIDLMKRGVLKLDFVKKIVLDEADYMLDLGFIEDIKYILKQTNKDKRVYLFSATFEKRIRELAKRFLKNEVLVEIKDISEKPDIKQILINSEKKDKVNLIKNIINIEKNFYGIIFCNTKREVDDIANILRKNFKVGFFHGDVVQSKRQKIVNLFRNKVTNILIASDVAARGIDIKEITHIINYSLPKDITTYTHRIGRCGRAKVKGEAISFSQKKDAFLIKQIKQNFENVNLKKIENNKFLDDDFDFKIDSRSFKNNRRKSFSKNKNIFKDKKRFEKNKSNFRKDENKSKNDFNNKKAFSKKEKSSKNFFHKNKKRKNFTKKTK